jgi:predicted alpha/beta-fold hydrolase
MPILASRFQPPAFLSNGHIQTILPLPRRLSIAFERERLELEDGDFLDLDWARLGGEKLAILSHGLEGCSDNGYIRGMATSLLARDGMRSRGISGAAEKR